MFSTSRYQAEQMSQSELRQLESNMIQQCLAFQDFENDVEKLLHFYSFNDLNADPQNFLQFLFVFNDVAKFQDQRSLVSVLFSTLIAKHSSNFIALLDNEEFYMNLQRFFGESNCFYLLLKIIRESDSAYTFFRPSFSQILDSADQNYIFFTILPSFAKKFDDELTFGLFCDFCDHFKPYYNFFEVAGCFLSSRYSIHLLSHKKFYKSLSITPAYTNYIYLCFNHALIETHENQYKSSGEIVSNAMKYTPFFQKLFDLVSSHCSCDDPKIIGQISKLIFSVFPDMIAFYDPLCEFIRKELSFIERCDVVASICKMLTFMDAEKILSVFDESLFQMLFQDISCTFSDVGDCILEALMCWMHFYSQKNADTFQKLIERIPDLINVLNSVLESDVDDSCVFSDGFIDKAKAFFSVLLKTKT